MEMANIFCVHSIESEKGLGKCESHLIEQACYTQINEFLLNCVSHICVITRII